VISLTRSSVVRSLIFPPPCRGSTKVPSPTRVSRPGAYIRLELVCRREGYEPWIMPIEVNPNMIADFVARAVLTRSDTDV
jgi:hypothetical protein